MTASVTAPYELLDDGYAPPPCEVLVIGCGNILRGDDALGPILIRTMFARGAPEGVRLVDGGTAGMDVAFGMRGAQRVVIVDASATGAEPGTIYRVPADQLDDVPAMTGLHSHNFRWDHALSLSAWLLGPERPEDITVFLVEAESVTAGDTLTPKVEEAMHTVCALIEAEFYPPASGEANAVPDASHAQVEITTNGYLHLDAATARRWFPAGVLVARRSQQVLELMPLNSIENGGLMLRQRNVAGDQTLLISEVLGFEQVHGTFTARWQPAAGALVIDLSEEDPS